ITKDTQPADPHLYRELFGTFSVPSFLTDDTVYGALQLDDHGMPVYRAPQDFVLVVHIPQCAKKATAPLPIMVFGHGLFGSALGEMNSGYEKSVTDQLCMVQVGTNWTGLSEDDAGIIGAKVLPDFSNFN